MRIVLKKMTLNMDNLNRKVIENNKKNNFKFVNSGFNLRPLDVTAAIGYNQFKRLNQMIKTRAKARAVSADEYMKGNLLLNEVRAEDVAKVR